MQSAVQSAPVATVPRSYLFVPGDRLDRLDKALATDADIVIIDLEDAVPPDRKAAARAALLASKFPRERVWVRVNASDVACHADDVQAALQAGVAGVVLPKAEDPDAIAQLAARLSGDTQIVALVETALGVWQALDVARSPKVCRLAFGSLDFKLDAGIHGDGLELLYARSRLVLASRVAGLPAPIDGVTTALNDAGAIERDAQAARRLGFGAKLCIHPSQVAAVNNAMLPSDAEFAWAEAVLAATAGTTGAAVSMNGQMVDRPEIERAARIAQSRHLRNPRSQ